VSLSAFKIFGATRPVPINSPFVFLCLCREAPTGPGHGTQSCSQRRYSGGGIPAGDTSLIQHNQKQKTFTLHSGFLSLPVLHSFVRVGIIGASEKLLSALHEKLLDADADDLRAAHHVADWRGSFIHSRLIEHHHLLRRPHAFHYVHY